VLGLILKDFLNLKWFIFLGLFLGIWFIGVFARYNAPLFLIIAGWMLVWFILARGLFALDQHTQCEAIINSLPLSKREIVAGRHLTSLAFLAYGFLVMFLWYVILKAAGILPGMSIPWVSVIALGLPVAAVLTAILFPLLFKLDFVKARWITVVVVFSFLFPSLEMVRSPGNKTTMPDWIQSFLNTPAFLRVGIAALAFAVLTHLSILVCTRLYRTREF